MSTHAISHEYEISATRLGRRLAGLGLAIALGSLALHALHWAGVLPRPTPTELEAVIIAEKARLARISEPAEVLLLGDSSCLMDVDAPELERLLGRTVVNLGTVSYLGLSAQKELMAEFIRSHATAPKWIVVLMHPEALRRSESVPGYESFLRRELAGKGGGSGLAVPTRFEVVTGADLLRGRVLSSVIPTLLPGGFGTEYGSNWELIRVLGRNAGSLVEPGTFDAMEDVGSHEYRLAAGLEGVSQDFRTSVPDSCRICVGITPVAAPFAKTDYAETHATLLSTWAGWMNAEGLDLPATLPVDQFASRTHLNARGVRAFTHVLARQLLEVAGFER